MCVLKGTTVSCRGWLAIYPGLSNDRPWDNYRLCIVVECTACWPILYIASVPARNSHVRRALVLNIIATFATHRVSGQALCSMAGGGGVYIKFIMLLTRNSTESAFFSRNRPKPTTYKILRTVTTLHDTFTKSQQTYRSSKCRSSWSQSVLFSTSIWESIAETSVSILFIGAVIEGNLSRHTALISCHRFVDDPGDEENSASWACDELSRHRRAIHKHKGRNITKNSSILSSAITTISNSSPPSPFPTLFPLLLPPSPYPQSPLSSLLPPYYSLLFRSPSLSPYNLSSLIMARKSDLNPHPSPIIILLLTLLIMSKRTTDRDFSPESHLQQSQRFPNYPREKPPVMLGARLYKLWIKLTFIKHKDLLFSICMMVQLQRRCNWP